jgi:hypothetical protein
MRIRLAAAIGFAIGAADLSVAGAAAIPIFTGSAAAMCAGEKFYDANGDVQQGTKDCAQAAPAPEPCRKDGAVGCLAGASFKAADTSAFAAADIRAGKTVAGVAGAFGDCSADGDSSCVVDGGAFKAAKLGNFTDSDIRSGVTVAGIAGTLSLAPATCASDAATGCITDGSFKAARMTSVVAGNFKAGATIAGVAGGLADCAADGATGCSAVADFKAADMRKVVAGNVKAGVKIAGVTGAYPSVTDKLPGAGATSDLVSLAASTAAGAYEWWGADGSRYTGTISDAGALTPGTAPQTLDAAIYRQFTVAGDANLVAGEIKNGASIFGVSGLYPSAAHPLSGAGSGGVTTDLDATSFDARMRSSTQFQWWDRAGIRYVHAGDANVVDANLADGVTLFGVTGTLIGASDCTGDGQTGCVSTARFKSMDTDSSAISAWDIRAGKTAGGLAGKLVFYANMADTTLFDRTTGAGGASGLDAYDTIDDYADDGVFPTQNPWSPPMSVPGANWLRDAASDTDTDGACNGAEACVYKDLITGLLWQKDDDATRDWETALTYCHDLDYGGHASGWRLPTQKEMMQAYADGIWLEEASLSVTDQDSYWSSTTYSGNTARGWIGDLFRGSFGHDTKVMAYHVVCVR